MHFTSVRALNLHHYLYKSMVKMAYKVWRLGEDHHASLFHHGLVKVLLCHQLAQINLSWDGFIYSTSLLSSLVQSSSHTTPLNSLAHQEVAFTSRPISRTPRAEVTQTFVIGKRLLFSTDIFERDKPTSGEEEASPHHEAPL